MINSTERARDALCGDRQTAVSSEDISLKSKVLVLMCCRFSGEAVKSAWSHLKALNSITAKHTLGCKDSNELGPKALPVVLGWPHSRELCCPHWRELRRPLSTLTWSGATVRDAHGVAETTWWARWEAWLGKVRGGGRARSNGGSTGQRTALCTVSRPSRWHSHRTLLLPAAPHRQTNPAQISTALPGRPAKHPSLTGLMSEPVYYSVILPPPPCWQPWLIAALLGLQTFLHTYWLLHQLPKCLIWHSEPHGTAWATLTATAPACRYSQAGRTGSRLIVSRGDPHLGWNREFLLFRNSLSGKGNKP